MENILPNIKKHRKQQGLSHWRIARLLGISKSAYTMTESGQTSLSVERLFKIAQILNVPVTEIIKENRL